MSEEKKENNNTVLGDIREAISTVQDPEIGRNIVELGLVYDILYETEKKFCQVDMTLTSPMCPYGPFIIEQTKSVVYAIEEVKEVDVQIIWEPQWDPRAMASEDVKLELGIWDEDAEEEEEKEFEILDEETVLNRIKEKLNSMEVEYLKEKRNLMQLVAIDENNILYQDGFCQIPMNLSNLSAEISEDMREPMKVSMLQVRDQVTTEIRTIRGVIGTDIELKSWFN